MRNVFWTMVLLCVIVAPAGAGLLPTPISNASFETDAVHKGISITDWYEHSVSSPENWDPERYWEEGESGVPNTPHGTYWGTIYDRDDGASTPTPEPSLYQAIGTWESDLYLTVSFLCGDRPTSDFSLDVKIWVGNVTGADGTAMSDLAVTQLDGTWNVTGPSSDGGTSNESSVFNTGTTDYTGQTLWLEFSSTTTTGYRHAYIDNVSVTPEPATMSLLALGGIGMLIRRRRLRR